MSKINIFFFGDEEIHFQDYMYFYGTHIAVLGILSFLAIFCR